MWAEWAVDASMGHEPGEPWCLVPVEPDRVVVGMMFMHYGNEPPEFPGGDGKLVAIYHQDGEAATSAFIRAHKAELDALFGRSHEKAHGETT
jgi:hypothetical protein